MKRFLICATIFGFLFQAVAGSALAAGCASHEGHAAKAAGMSQMESSASADITMPCHEAGDQQGPDEHCNGTCLCFATCVSKIPVLHNSYTMPAPAYIAAQWDITDYFYKSHTNAPPKRPPKIYS